MLKLSQDPEWGQLVEEAVARGCYTGSSFPSTRA